ncbi:MAG: stage III sporulation protein AD [Clostridia bacterium]|nr:stage III sporulation protein AD [Clostridia bacterium]
MNEIIKICGVALVGLVAVSVMRGLKNDFSAFVGIATGLVLLGFAVGALYPLIEYVQKITEGSGFSLYIETILKALGIAVVAESAADICRDFGESAIAARVEFAAKSLIMLLALPVVESLLALAFGVLE